MLRTLTGRAGRKFSFDLALHRSREKGDDDDTGKRRTPQPPRRRKILQVSSPRPAPQRASSSNRLLLGTKRKEEEETRPKESQDEDLGPRTFVGPKHESVSETEETKQSWLRMREARKNAAQSPTKFRPSKESSERGRSSARGDDAPRIRELSRDKRGKTADPITIRTLNSPAVKLDQKKNYIDSPPRPPPPPPLDDMNEYENVITSQDEPLPSQKTPPRIPGAMARPSPPQYIIHQESSEQKKIHQHAPTSAESETGTGTGTAMTDLKSLSLPAKTPQPPPASKRTDSTKKPPRKPLVLQDPPSWQQLKTKAMEADFSSMIDFIENFGTARRHELRSSRNADQMTAFAFSRSYTPNARDNEALMTPRATTSDHQSTDGIQHQLTHEAPSILSKKMRAQSASRAPQSADTGGESIRKSRNGDNGPTFDKWFTTRFPENNLSSAPSAHKALWAEYDRQMRFKRLESRRNSRDHPSDDLSNSSYLDRLRGVKQNPSSVRHRDSDTSSAVWTPAESSSLLNPTDTKSHITYKSGSIESPGRILVPSDPPPAAATAQSSSDRIHPSQRVRTTLHTVTWRVERWSALPSGFRQGARYRPPGGAPWSLDLYKGGIKRERPGMIALYVHYDAPNSSASATVTSLELSLMNQTTGAHLMRKHEGTRVFGPKADPKRRISTSAGTASLAHLCLTQVEKLGFCVNDIVVLRAEIEVLVPGSMPST